MAILGLPACHAKEAGVEALGYVVENNWLGSVLIQRAEQMDIQLKGSAQVKSIHPKAQSIELRVDVACKEQIINSQLLVVADGANSACAKMLGIHQQSKAYDQSAIIANLELEQPHQAVAYERFTDQGPMALLPLADFQNSHQ